MSDFEGIISSNKLELTFVPVTSNPYMPHSDEGMMHFFCNFKGERVNGFEFYISIESSNTEFKPSAELALSLIFEDVNLYKQCEGFSDLARILLLDDSDDPSTRIAFAEMARFADFVDTLVLPAPIAGSAI